MVQTTENNATGATTYSAFYCVNRLPCGVCTRTMSICPLDGNAITVTPTWNSYEVTCQSNGAQK